MRSVAWLALFSAAVLAPLGVAVSVRSAGGSSLSFTAAFGAALGWLAFGLLSVEFGLVSRIRAAAAWFGSDALLLFHRAMAFAALAFVAAHIAFSSARWPNPLAGSSIDRSGAVAVWAVAALIASSVLRRRACRSYELWLFAHRSLAVVIVVAMLAHAWAALGPDASAPRAVAGLYAGGALVVLAVRRILRPMFRRPWEVVGNRDEGASTRTLVLRAVGHAGLRFEPGQFVWLATARRKLFAQEHPISIASSPMLDDGRTIELAIKALGDWSRDEVPRLRLGDRVRVDGPFGAFSTSAVRAERFVFIAGGVGVTPVRSMLLAMRDRGDRRPATLLFAAHDRTRAMFADELEALQGELDLRVVFVFEEPATGERCERGFVSPEILRRHLPSDLRGVHVFVCGPAPMMDAVESASAELGLPAAQLHTERFDMI